MPARASRSLTGRQNGAISLVSRNKMDPKKMEARSNVGACMLSESLYTSVSLRCPAPIPQCHDHEQAACTLTCQPPSRPHHLYTGVFHHERLGDARRLSLNLESHTPPIALTSLECASLNSPLMQDAGIRIRCLDRPPRPPVNFVLVNIHSKSVPGRSSYKGTECFSRPQLRIFRLPRRGRKRGRDGPRFQLQGDHARRGLLRQDRSSFHGRAQPHA